jgi:hypothetical protein
VIKVTSADVALMGEEQVAPQRMQTLALVGLTTYAATEFFVGDVPAGVEGADESAVLVQCLGVTNAPATVPKPTARLRRCVVARRDRHCPAPWRCLAIRWP